MRGYTLRERSYVRKLAKSLNEICSGTVDNEQLEAYRRRITNNRITFQRELEYVLTILDRLISEDKSILLGKLYVAYIKGEIDWKGFCQYSETIDRLLIGDFRCLHIDVRENMNRSEDEYSSLQRLVLRFISRSVYNI